MNTADRHPERGEGSPSSAPREGGSARSRRRRHRPLRLPLGLAALAALAALPVRAHDFWIEPSAYTTATAAPIALALRVGDGFAGEPVPRDPGHLARFALVGAAAELEVPGLVGSDPAGWVSPPEGAWVAVYRSHPASLVLDGPTFTRYLAEEGLEAVHAERAQRGQTTARVRERFSRCAKSLLRIGGAPDASVFRRPIGLTLELVPESDPTVPGAADRVFRLLHEGAPLAGTLVAAIPAGARAERVAARTDAEGRVRLRLDRAGPWLVKAVHMIPGEAGSGADWESLWASLTFAVAE